MIAFVTLFVVLVSGPQAVEVAVGDAVATVELRLDGRVVGVIRGAPWRAVVDFGPWLAPHELEAVAVDAAGREVGRCRQLVNLPRPAIDARFVLDRDQGGVPRRARLAVGTASGRWPSEVRVTFGGRELVGGDDGWFGLPDVTDSSPGLLTARLALPDGETARLDLALGSTWGGEAAAELTAVPLLLERRVGPLTAAGVPAMAAGGRPLEVVAVERPGARVLVVRDRAALPRLGELAVEQERLDRVQPRQGELLGGGEPTPDQSALQLVLPAPTRVGQTSPAVDLFRVTPWYRLRPGLLPWTVTHLVGGDQGGQRLADAVAVAAVRAAAWGGPRAVVLLVGDRPEDESGQTPEAVRRYLGALGVPLRVWSTARGDRQLGGWGPAEDVSSRRKLRRAAGRLEEHLGRQWVVWVTGSHLPGSVRLVDPPPGFELLW